MGRHIIQKWYEFTIGYPENDRYGSDCQLVIENDDRYGWDYRLVIENDDRYGWDYRLVFESDDRYGPKKRLNIENTITMVETKIGDKNWWLKGSKISSVDGWLKMSTAGIENINWQLRDGKDCKQAGTSSGIIHPCLHQVASQFSRHFREKHGVKQERVLWLMKGKEYSKNYNRKHLNFPNF